MGCSTAATCNTLTVDGDKNPRWRRIATDNDPGNSSTSPTRLVRAAFEVGFINRLALQTTSTEGLTIRTINSPTAHRNVALFWTRRRADSAVVKAFLDAQQRAPLPPGVVAI